MTELKASLVLQLKNMLRGGIAQVRGELKGLKSEAQGLGNIRGPNAAGMAAYGAEARRSTIALRELKREQAMLGRAGGAAGGGNTILAATGRTALALGGVYGAMRVGNAAIREAITFEQAMAQVRKKVDGADNPAVFAEIEASVKRMAQAYGIAQVEMAKLVAEAGASGIAVKDLSQFMNVAAKASVGWDMGAQETAQVLAQIKAGSQMSVSEISDLADMINYLGDSSAAKERDIVEMFQRSGEAAKAAGVDTKSTLAFLTGARSMGIGTEIGGRFFGAFTSKLVNPSKKGKEALTGLGLSFAEVQKGMEKAPFETMIKVLDRLRGSARRAEFAKELFGAEWFDEALRLAGGIKEVEKAYKGLQSSSNWRGSLDKGLSIELATTAKHLDRLKALAQDVGDSFSRWALPPINASIGKLLDLVDRLRGRTADVIQKEGSDGEMKKVSEYETSAAEKDKGAIELRKSAKTTRNKQDRLTLIQRADNLEREARELRERAETARETARAMARTAQGDRTQKAQDGDRQSLKRQVDQIQTEMNEDGTFKSPAQKQKYDDAAKKLRAAEEAERSRLARERAAEQELKEKARRESGEDQRRAGLQRLQGVLNQAQPGQDFVRDPSTGANWNVETLRREVDRLKQQLGEVSGEAEKTGAAVKDKLTLDLTSQGAATAMSWAQGLRAGVPAVEAAAAALRAPIMTPAAPVGGGGPRPITGGGATAPSRPTQVQVAGIHIHGVSDPDRAAKRAVAELAQRIRSGNEGAHHDGVT